MIVILEEFQSNALSDGSSSTRVAVAISASTISTPSAAIDTAVATGTHL